MCSIVCTEHSVALYLVLQQQKKKLHEFSAPFYYKQYFQLILDNLHNSLGLKNKDLNISFV